MRVLVVQTARMGDALQTTPLLHAVRARHPDAHITAMVRKMSVPIMERHPDVGEVIVYNEDSMFQNLCARDSRRLLQAYQEADALVQRLRNARFDIAYNATHNRASAMLLKLAGIPEVVGAHIGDEGQFLLRGRWTQYYFTSVLSREYNDLNTCDIFAQLAEDAESDRRLRFEPNDADKAFVEELLTRHGIASEEFVACMQLGASEPEKRWPPERFAQLARLLIERHGARVFLLGVKEEAALGEAFQHEAPGLAVPLYGKTTLSQAAALLQRARVLVTNDTGTMHIAAAVNCPVALISVGHVHYRETGPYGAGHCAIEVRRESLGSTLASQHAADEAGRVTAEQALTAVEVALSSDVLQRDESIRLRDVDLFVSRFAPDGFLQFYPVLRRPLAERDLLRIAYRAMWLDYLRGGSGAETESMQRMLRHYDGPPDDTVAAMATHCSALFEEAAGVGAEGQGKAQTLLETLCAGNVRQAREQVGGLSQLDAQIRVLGELHPPLLPLALMANFERDNLEGSDPHLLAQQTAAIYEALAKRAQLVAEKLARISTLWREGSHA